MAQQASDVPLPRARPGPAASEAPARNDPAALRQQAAPQPRARAYQAACPAVLSGQVLGSLAPPIGRKTCQAASPYRIRALVIGDRTVRLSRSALLNCQMAGELARWAKRLDAYVNAVFHAGLAEIKIGTSYMCRPRNRQPGARLSEHGFANALDLSGFVLDNGTEIALPGDWRGGGKKAMAMRYAHQAACGFFTTVLGPDANALHADHLHFDLGCHGKDCTWRLCE